MAAVSEDTTFLLERFEWLTPERLEVMGRWNGAIESPQAPTLVVYSGDEARRLSMIPGSAVGDTDDGQRWQASFEWVGEPAGLDGAVLEFGEQALVHLPAPRPGRRRFGRLLLEVERPDRADQDPASPLGGNRLRETLATMSALVEEAVAVERAATQQLADVLERAQASLEAQQEETAEARADSESAHAELAAEQERLLRIRAALESAETALRTERAERDRAQAALGATQAQLQEATERAQAEGGRVEELRRDLAGARETLAAREEDVAGLRVQMQAVEAGARRVAELEQRLLAVHRALDED